MTSLAGGSNTRGVRSPAERERALASLHDEIRACRRCALAGHAVSGMPVISGDPALVHQPNRLLLVGQAPGKTEAVNGRPFSGPAGKRLFKWLASVGIDEEDFRRRVYMAALTRCFPGPAPSGHGDRRASPAELALCRPFLDRAIELLQPHTVVLVGGMAIETFLGKLPLEAAVGTVHVRDGVRYLPLPHPSGASTWTNHPEHQALLQDALSLLGDVWREPPAAHAPLPGDAARHLSPG